MSNLESIFYLEELCVVAQSAIHTSPSFILSSITYGFKIKLIKTIDIINNNVINVTTK